MADDAMIPEFTVQDLEEKELSETVKVALKQIDDKKYEKYLSKRRNGNGGYDGITMIV